MNSGQRKRKESSRPNQTRVAIRTRTNPNRNSERLDAEEEEEGGGEEEKGKVKMKKTILSDSDEDEDKEVKKSRLVSDDDDSGSDEGSGAPDKSLAAKLKELGSDSEDEEDMKRDAGKKDEKALFGSDSDSGDDVEEKMTHTLRKVLVDEEEEEGFNQEELEAERPQVHALGQQGLENDSDSDDDVDRGGKDMSFMSDFDIMLARKKAQSGKRRRNRDGGTFINNGHGPIFGLSSNFKGMTREERQQRDLDQQIAPRRRLSEPQTSERQEEPDVFAPALSSGGQTPRRDLEKVLTGEEKALRPGDPSFLRYAPVCRCLAPIRSYVVRSQMERGWRLKQKEL
ncbi:hypothetical protein QQF64_008135 [Cirrhinus molitorella]|uniref:Uncharacterized protein n=1 Tax=Cirrhinus molitorella TaxID=172907 RepID=A0ABR3M5B4_9TELE